MAHVCFILHPQFQMLAYVLASETLRIANRRAGRPLFSWETRTATSAPVEASNGQTVGPNVTGWADTTRPDLVLVIAGYDPLAARSPGLASFLGRAGRAGSVLGGIDTGVAVLAAHGLLSGPESVVLHREAEAAFREAWPEIKVDPGIYALSGRRMSAAGGTATCDAMLAWIAARVSPGFAEEVAEDMAHGSIRPSATRQRFRDTADPVLQAMYQRMLNRLDRPLEVSEIAKQLGLSTKVLRARCRKALGLTPSQYYLALRLAEARDLLAATQMPVTEIAMATGFGSHAGFSRTFRHRYGTSPRQFRKAAAHRKAELAG